MSGDMYFTSHNDISKELESLNVALSLKGGFPLDIEDRAFWNPKMAECDTVVSEALWA